MNESLTAEYAKFRAGARWTSECNIGEICVPLIRHVARHGPLVAKVELSDDPVAMMTGEVKTSADAALVCAFLMRALDVERLEVQLKV